MRTFPVLFSSLMVLALLDGRKSQTRRLMTSPLAEAKPGDLLWVREAVRLCERRVDRLLLRYKADGHEEWKDVPASEHHRLTFRSSMHMPRFASRLTLEVMDVRFQRLQFISEWDVEAEGATRDQPFGQIWAKLHQKPGTRWEDNPPIVALTFDCHKRHIDEFVKQKGLKA